MQIVDGHAVTIDLVPAWSCRLFAEALSGTSLGHACLASAEKQL
jgi:hypothetical protein